MGRRVGEEGVDCLYPTGRSRWLPPAAPSGPGAVRNAGGRPPCDVAGPASPGPEAPLTLFSWGVESCPDRGWHNPLAYGDGARSRVATVLAGSGRRLRSMMDTRVLPKASPGGGCARGQATPRRTAHPARGVARLPWCRCPARWRHGGPSPADARGRAILQGKRRRGRQRQRRDGSHLPGSRAGPPRRPAWSTRGASGHPFLAASRLYYEPGV
jgi:hypothetical protein